MKFIFKRKCFKRIVFGTLIIGLILFVIVFVGLPIIFRSSYSLQKNFVFLHFVSVPVDFTNPGKSGLIGTRNLYVSTNDNVTLGVWHTVPNNQLATLLIRGGLSGSEKVYDDLLESGKNPIFIYMHGNSGNRGSGHRVDLYKMLQANNYHVISFDYRSYGDSSSVSPSEDGVVNDTKAIYNWVKQRSGNSKIFFWGHSLGTGISSHALRELTEQGEKISGIVLESPFNNLKSEVEAYPLAQLFRFLPWFNYFFTDPLSENGLKFESDEHLSAVSTPIMIIHAEDDFVVPFKLGLKLYDTVKAARGNGSRINFIPFTKDNHYGHKFIVKDKELPHTIKSFVTEVLTTVSPK